MRGMVGGAGMEGGVGGKVCNTKGLWTTPPPGPSHSSSPPTGQHPLLPLPSWDQVTTLHCPQDRSQHLPPLGLGHNSSLPPLWTTPPSLPLPPGTRSPYCPPPLGPGHNTALPWDYAQVGSTHPT